MSTTPTPGGPLRGRIDDPLLTPFDLKGVRLRNRIVSTSHEPAYGEDGMPKDRYRAYHVAKAVGGVGLTMIGGSAVVSPDSPPAFGNLLLYRDEIVDWLRRLTEEVHDVGAAVMCQVTHLGRRTSNYTGDWLPVVAASPLREPAHRAFPKQAELWDLDRIVDDYVAAAQRCVAGGLDGIELEAYGHLLDGFLSPATNHRDDDFGGDLAGRLAFPRRVVAAVRTAVGTDFPVGIRLVIDEDLPHGLQASEGIAALRTLTHDGVDFVSVIRGHIDNDVGLVKVIPIMGMRSAPFLDFVGEVKQSVDIPVMHAARIADVTTARYAVESGLLDLVGMTRAQIADPQLVAKLTRGDEDRIRPCVGASYCLDAIYDSGDAKCIHNPATGRELTLPQVIAPTTGARRRAVVVGGGPAGLEAARVLAERGHHVVLFEANSRPGGQLLLASTSARRRDLVAIADWRADEARRCGADLRFGTYAEAGEVLAESPDLVVVATGGLPNREFLTVGADLVDDTWDLLSRAVQPGAEVLVYDDNGAFPGMDAVEFLVDAGSSVDYVTPERALAPDVGGMNIPAYLTAFARGGVSVTLAHRLTRVERDGARLRAVLFSEYAELETVRVVDQVVVEHGTLPNADLYHQLQPRSVNGGAVDVAELLAMRPQSLRTHRDGAFQLFRIGDAVTSRNVHAAVLDALRLCAPM